jgi:hypothetical protein
MTAARHGACLGANRVPDPQAPCRATCSTRLTRTGPGVVRWPGERGIRAQEAPFAWLGRDGESGVWAKPRGRGGFCSVTASHHQCPREILYVIDGTTYIQWIALFSRIVRGWC